jgi:type I restriction enzyme S subunit
MTYLASYPSTRDSGISWLGQIPTHWKAKRVKFVARFAYGDSLAAENREDGEIPVFGSNGIVGTHTKANTKSPCLIIGRKGSYGKVNYSDTPCFAIDTTYFVDPQTTKDDIRFLFYAFPLLKLDESSQDTGVPGLSREFAYNHWLPVPPRSEQRTIATFLDRQTAKIDTLIAKKQHLLELLAEQRSAIIGHALTKGLNPTVKMKDSGVVWLGQVPSHWEIDLTKRHFNIELGKMLDSSKQPENGFLKPYLRAANIYWEGVWLDDINEMKFTKQQLMRYSLQKGDLLVTEGGVTVGRSTIWQGEMEDIYYQNSINRARPKGTLPVKYLYYWLYALKLNGYIDNAVSKATFGHLTKDKLELLPMTVPPKPEAEIIANYLDAKLVYLARVEEKIKGVVGQLREYRSALITSVVTGKIDVRGGVD